MKISAQAICNTLLVKAKKEKIKINAMKLQKLLYLICVKYAKQAGRLPIYEYFNVWQYGPVLPSIYFIFQPYKDKPIKKFALNAKKEIKIVNEQESPLLKRCIDFVWDKYKNYNARDLAQYTMQENSAWYTAYQANKDILLLEDIKNDINL